MGFDRYAPFVPMSEGLKRILTTPLRYEENNMLEESLSECQIHVGCFSGTRSPCPLCLTESLKHKQGEWRIVSFQMIDVLVTQYLLLGYEPFAVDNGRIWLRFYVPLNKETPFAREI
jgi:hypothetical protein